jgi:hypothetical protein
MSRNREPSGSVAALPEVISGALQGHRTASMSKCTTATQTPSSWQAHVVDLRSEVCERAPALDRAWADAIQARFSWLWRA